MQQKTGEPLWIPEHRDLTAELALMREGLPKDCVMHGLRRNAAQMLAEAGCPVHEIAAITGHKSLKEIERYTRGVDQKRLATAAIHRLEQNRNGTASGKRTPRSSGKQKPKP